MIRTLEHKDIEALAHGESIPRFVAKIRKVWEQKSGESEYGTWHLQNMNVLMKDADDELVVCWTGEDPFDETWQKKYVAFECGTNKQGKLVGVVRDIRTSRDGKVYKGVKLTPACTIRKLEQQDELLKDAAPAAKQTSEASPNAQGSSPDRSESDKIDDYAKHAGRIFARAWDEAGSSMSIILFEKSNEEGLTVVEKLDLQLRIAQNIAIEINKIIRKERF